MKCHDCGRELSNATNDNPSGWVIAGGDAFCPVCLRLSRCEKDVGKISEEIEELAKDFKKLLSVLVDSIPVGMHKPSPVKPKGKDNVNRLHLS